MLRLAAHGYLFLPVASLNFALRVSKLRFESKCMAVGYRVEPFYSISYGMTYWLIYADFVAVREIHLSILYCTVKVWLINTRTKYASASNLQEISPTKDICYTVINLQLTRLNLETLFCD